MFFISFASRASGLRTLTKVYAAVIELSDNFDNRNWQCVISDVIQHVCGDEKDHNNLDISSFLGCVSIPLTERAL